LIIPNERAIITLFLLRYLTKVDVMRFFCLVILLSLCVGCTHTPIGTSKRTLPFLNWPSFYWPARHWKVTGQDQDFKPYKDDPILTHLYRQKLDANWKPQQWISAVGGAEKTMDLLYRADIIRAQNESEGIPVMVVGPAFYRLSPENQRKMVQVVDHIYGITQTHPAGLFYLRDWHTKYAVGLYDHNGLQMQ
jgi:hypothetical protein